MLRWGFRALSFELSPLASEGHPEIFRGFRFAATTPPSSAIFERSKSSAGTRGRAACAPVARIRTPRCGVRPSPAAATSERTRTAGFCPRRTTLHLAAPEDGRTPGGVTECGRPRPQQRPHARLPLDFASATPRSSSLRPRTGALRAVSRSAAVPGRSNVRTLGCHWILPAPHHAPPRCARGRAHSGRCHEMRCPCRPEFHLPRSS